MMTVEKTIVTIEAIVQPAFLSFLVLRPGDTDKEYFEKYTEQQLTWCQGSVVDEISGLLLDFEEGGDSPFEDMED